MIEVRDLERSYGDTKALRGLSFSIRAGEVVGLLGHNGAGKTTTMKILVGALHPDAGSARVAGFDVVQDPIEVQSRIGYLPENAPLYPEMLVQDYLGFMADMRAMTGTTRRTRITHVVDHCGIGRVLTRPIGHLSKGYRQRVGLASALLHDPPLLILDEPTGGLDPSQIVEVRELIRGLGEAGKTVILSTHILPEVEATCGRAIIILDGLKRADGTLKELTRGSAEIVTVAVDDPTSAADLLGRIDAVARVTAAPAADGYHTFRLQLDREVEVGDEVSRLARERGWPLRELRRDDRSLEVVFRELNGTGQGAAA